MRGRRLAGGVLAAAGAVLLVVVAAHVASGMRAQARGFDAPSTRAVRTRLPGDALGRLELPRVGLAAVVFEGDSEATLRKGPGHVPGTAWPADAERSAGNCVIAGHRDSFFRLLRDAREGDLVRLVDASGVRSYRLETRRVVRPSEVSVLGPTRDARLTLITCYPFRWIGAAPSRLVWIARPVSPALASAGSAAAR
jgi:LPXTG-site transpeptidase (sortase) family protein